MITNLKVFVLMTLVSVVHGQCPGLKVYDSNGNIITHDVCVRMYTTAECLRFYKSFNQSDLPEGFPRGTGRVGKPSYIKVDIPPLEKEKPPALSVTWKSPEIGITSVLGFLVLAQYETADLAPQCALFQTKKGNNAVLKYNHIVENVLPRSGYLIKVYSLPQLNPKSKFDDSMFASTTVAKLAMRAPVPEPGRWTTSMAIEMMTNSSIRVKFSLPPSAFKITRFLLQLFNKRDMQLSYKGEHANTKPMAREHTIETVLINSPKSGQYKLAITPVETAPMKYWECVCWITETGIKKCLESCRSTYSDWFYVPEKDEAQASTSDASRGPFQSYSWCLLLLLKLFLLK